MGLLSIPKTYTPRKGAPKEYPIYASKAEQELLRHATDGKADKTKHGILSFYMEGSSTGNYRDSKPSQSSTRSTGGGISGGSSAGVGGVGRGSGSTSPASGGSNSNSGTSGGRDNGMRDSVGANAPSRSSPSSSDRGYNSNPAAGMGRYGGVTSPAAARAASSWADVQRQAAAVRGLLGQPRGVSPQYDGPARYNSPFNANRSQQAFGGYPNSMAGMMPGQPNGFASPVNQVAGLNPSTFPARPGVIAENNISTPPAVSAMKRARQSTFPARPGVIAANNQPEAAPQPFSSTLGYLDPAALEARARAVSRGPGSVAGVMPGASPLSQERTLQTLAGAMSDAGTPISASDLQRLSQTIAGETAGQPTMGQTAAANTMFNRMALAAAGKSKHLGGASIPSLMGQYDATGLRNGTKPNSAFTGAVLGTDALGAGIASLAGAFSPNSQFSTTMPPAIQNATHFLTRAAQKAQQKYPQGPRNWSNNPAQPFSPVGAHLFGNAENTAAQVASLRSGPRPSGPTQTAGLSPAAAPPSPQVATGESMWDRWAPNVLKTAVTAVDENIVQPTQEQIQKYGGFKRAGALARTAVAIMDFMPGGSGGRPSGRGSFGKGGNRDDSGGNGGRGNGTAPLPVTPPPAPPVNPMTPWLYPQYQSQWAGLPVGLGGYARG